MIVQAMAAMAFRVAVKVAMSSASRITPPYSANPLCHGPLRTPRPNALERFASDHDHRSQPTVCGRAFLCQVNTPCRGATPSRARLAPSPGSHQKNHDRERHAVHAGPADPGPRRLDQGMWPLPASTAWPTPCGLAQHPAAIQGALVRPLCMPTRRLGMFVSLLPGESVAHSPNPLHGRPWRSTLRGPCGAD